MLIKILLPLFTLCILFAQAYAQDTFTWPNGAKAAVCFTYDDALESQLNYAIPNLDQYGVKGTFFLSALAVTPETQQGWIDAAHNGHELASHTAFHPCSGNNDWVSPDFASENYSVDRMLKELTVCNNLLYALDGQTVRTYAYPCCETVVGGVDYKSALLDSGLYIGARGGQVSDIPKSMRDLDALNVPSKAVIELPVEALIDYVNTARDNGTMAVFMFHGVNGQYLKVDGQVHNDILAYLKANDKDFWVATFRDVMQHVVKERKRLNWD